MGRKHQLAELQLAIMHVLWDKKEATVAEVREALEPNRPLAHTTVATMLTKMEQNGQVSRRSIGRTLLYRAAVRRDTVCTSMVADLAKRLFQDDVPGMVNYLLDGCDVSREELDQLKSLIASKEAELGTEGKKRS